MSEIVYREAPEKKMLCEVCNKYNACYTKLSGRIRVKLPYGLEVNMMDKGVNYFFICDKCLEYFKLAIC